MSRATRFRGKFWCFTINNPTEEQLPPNVWEDVQYVIWQHEKGENGTEHIQGYVCFSKTKQLSWILENTVRECHWEPRVGSHDQAKHYCMKPVEGCVCKHCVDAVGQRIDGPWTWGSDDGIASGQGQRSDLLECKAMIDEGKSEAEVAEAHFGSWARNYKAFERYRKLVHGGRRDWITKVTVYWGAPGIGKSRRARHEAGESAYWLPQPDGGTVWWDGYDGQSVVVIDEFYGWIKRTAMQRLCDSTPTSVQNKGGSTPFMAKHIIITSNDPPSQWWHNIGLGPMERRLTGEHGSVIHMREQWVEPLPQQVIDAIVMPPIEELFDPAAEWAMFGTPQAESAPETPHAQDKLSRCPSCHVPMYLPELCEMCEHMEGLLGPFTD